MHYWIRFILISLPFFFVLPYLATNTHHHSSRFSYLNSSVIVSAEENKTKNSALDIITGHEGTYKSYNFSFDYYREVALTTQKKLEQQRIERERAEQERIAQEQAIEVQRQADEQAKQVEAARIQAEQQAIAAAQALAQQQAQQASYTAPSGDLKGYAYNRVCEVFGCNNWSAFDFIVTHESGWNPNVRNASSGACGLGQALPCSKMSSYGADYASNGFIQTNWTIDYIKGRYGNPNNAQVFWRSHNWY